MTVTDLLALLVAVSVLLLVALSTGRRRRSRVGNAGIAAHHQNDASATKAASWTGPLRR
ncbi:MAG: hypothetical protein ACRDUV_11970 [Pseudonocardiaceae bacterium]